MVATMSEAVNSTPPALLRFYSTGISLLHL